MNNKLYIRYCENEKDLVGAVPQGEVDRCDLYLVFLAFLKQPIYGYGISLIEELEKRGYDKTTLKFEIKKKATHQQEDKENRYE